MPYTIDFTDTANEDIDRHKKAGNRAALLKINTLLHELVEHPFTGTGKPEPLKHNFAGCWSRRINKEHRLVYTVTDDTIFINSAYGHYD